MSWTTTAILNLAPAWWRRAFIQLARSGIAARDWWSAEEVSAYLALSIGAYGQEFEVVLKDFEEELAEVRRRAQEKANEDAVSLEAWSAHQGYRWFPDWRSRSRAWLPK